MAIAERNFIYGPQLRKLGRILYPDRDPNEANWTALGAMICFWDDTQNAGFVGGTKEQILDYIGGTSCWSSKMFDAMLNCCLLSPYDDGSYLIVGNKKHVDALHLLSKSRSKNGKNRAKSATRDSNGRYQQTVQQPSSSHPANSSSVSVSVSDPVSNDLNGSMYLIQDLIRRPQIDAHTQNLEKKYLEKVGRIGQRLTPREREYLNIAIQAAGESVEKALDNFLADDRDYYKSRKWPLSSFVNDIGQHLSDKDSHSVADLFINAGKR